MKNFTERLLAAALLTFLLAYAGFQVYRYLYSPYQVQPALNYTVADQITVSGVIIRDETVIREQPAGVVNYLHEDGSKVNAGQTLAEIYQSQEDAEQQKQIRALDLQIENLEKAGDPANLQLGSAEALTSAAFDVVSGLAARADGGMMGQFASETEELTYLLNRRQMALGKVTGFDDRIQQLTAQRDALQATAPDYRRYSNPEDGYFVRMTDGLEDELTTDLLENLTPDLVRSYAKEKHPLTDQYLGKIAKDHNWYYAALVDREDLRKFKEGDVVHMNFSLCAQKNIPFTVHSLIDDGSSQAVAVLKGNYVLPDLSSMRNPTAEIIFTSYSGIRVPSTALRYQDQTPGVYVIENDIIRFKTINVIYQAEDFVLCGSNADEERPLKLFDQVVVKGMDLEDGKSIKL